MARPNKRTWQPPDWGVFDRMCQISCTLSEIAGVYDVSEDTIERACSRYQKLTFAEYHKRRAGLGKQSLRRKQFEIALAGNPTMLVWLGKQQLGQKDQTETNITGRIVQIIDDVNDS